MDGLTLAQCAYYGGHFAWWPIFPIFWVLLFVGLFFFFGRRRAHWYRSHFRGSGESVLAERYARGEINEDEYQKRLETLRGSQA